MCLLKNHIFICCVSLFLKYIKQMSQELNPKFILNSDLDLASKCNMINILMIIIGLKNVFSIDLRRYLVSYILSDGL